MKTLKAILGAAGLLALAAFAFSPPADAAPRGYERGGHGYHGPYKPYRYGHRHHYHGPRYYGGPRFSIGFVAPILPAGYVSLAVGNRPYYYHGGYFYRPAPSGYVVVSAPLGASVVSLPASAVQVQIGGFTYYQYADAYYQWQPASRAYVVVPPPAGVPIAAAPAPAAPAPGATGYAPGEVVEALPSGYSAEVINGVQYYRYGSDYFMPTQRDGQEVYVVVRI
ncbi:DUF6515 family protein [Microbulbifer magnicolonia]|uniref:DUF6515 family protein n=1 Tax=Microbulbifer magnicolonia TaxID=3109744 RepID=UPI002B4010EC|nr:DUF6515 family protein [Microbulbifer sp. GG15]